MQIHHSYLHTPVFTIKYRTEHPEQQTGAPEAIIDDVYYK
jgi:hypothetical protein